MVPKDGPRAIMEQIDEERMAAEWLRRYAEAGDRQALEEFFLCYQTRVYGFCVCLLGRSAAAEDATQTTFIDVMRRAGEFASIRSIRFWLFGMARKACTSQKRSEQRRSRRERLVMNDRSVVNRNTPAAGIDRSEIKGLILKALGHVPEQCRSALFLRYAQDLSHREIAETLGMKETTVRSTVARGLQQLKSRLSHQGLAAIPALLPAAFAQMGAEVPPELTRSLTQLSQAPLESVVDQAGALRAGSSERFSKVPPVSPWAGGVWALTGLVLLLLASGFALFRNRLVAQPGSEIAKVQQPNGSDGAGSAMEGRWDFNDKKLKGLKFVVGKWAFIPLRKNRNDLVLQFQHTPEDIRRFRLGSPILYTPTNLKLRPPVLVEFRAGTDKLKEIGRITLWANGAFWSDRDAFPPLLEELFVLKNDVERPPWANAKVKINQYTQQYKLYISENEVVRMENGKATLRFRMKRPWRNAKDRLYLLWVLQKGDAQLDNLHIKQLRPEEWPLSPRVGIPLGN